MRPGASFVNKWYLNGSWHFEVISGIRACGPVAHQDRAIDS